MRVFVGVCLALAATAGYADERASPTALAITHFKAWPSLQKVSLINTPLSRNAMAGANMKKALPYCKNIYLRLEDVPRNKE